MTRAIFILCALASTSCALKTTATTCDDTAAAGLTVHVIDQASGKALCDAQIIATDGSYSTSLELTESASDCYYTGVYERAGTYAIVVSDPGHQTYTQENIVVTQDGCHVVGKDLTVEL